MHYHLYPPFFIIDPQTSFDKAWEAFCLHLLNLENRTHTIQRCAPPDHGVDLIWDAAETAYQCKATERGRINMKKIEQSIQAALVSRSELHWQRYVLCTNVDLTGSQRLTLKNFLPDIEFMQQDVWISLCKKFHHIIADRFRVPVQIAQERVLRSLNEAYLREYHRSLPTTSSIDLLTLLVYSRLRDYLFELHSQLPFYTPKTRD